MRHTRYRKRSRTRATVFFAFFTLCLLGTTSVLAVKLPGYIHQLREVKVSIATFETTKEDLAKTLTSCNKALDALEEETEIIEQQLEKAREQYPELAKVLKDKSVKYAYLTFDDGPSNNTANILDFLKANHIKATFFVIGEGNHAEIYKRIVEEGHTLALHSDTHQYREIYRSVYSFMEDINDLSLRLEKITGVKPDVIRFPGGSNNTISTRYGGKDLMGKIITEVEKQGLHYFDWNVDSRDATKKYPKKEMIINSVLNGAKGKTEAIILMHDATIKTTTVDALPQIVEGLRKQGFILDKITSDTKPIHFK